MMIVFATVLFLLLLTVGWVLIAPLTLRIDTVSGDYDLRLRGIGGMRLQAGPGDWVVKARVLFWKKEWDLWRWLGQARRRKKGDGKARQPKTSRRRSRRISWKKMVRILKSFRVRRFRVEIDTDDYVLNAYLFPVFHLLSRGRLQINFNGRNDIQIEITNRIGRIAWAWLR